MNRTLPMLMCAAQWTAIGCSPVVESSGSRGVLPRILENSAALDETALEGAESNWPGWRGVNASGVSAAENLPVRWSSTRGIQWRTELPGFGKSSPVVWGDRVFLTSAIGVGKNPQLALVCLDLNTGRVRWQADVGSASDPIYTLNGPASATPVCDGSRVFAFFGTPGLFCYDLDGNRLWHADLGSVHHDWGISSGPVVYGDLVIQLCDHQGESFLAALDARSGREIWRTPRTSYGCWSTPVLVSANRGDESRTELVVNGTGSGAPGGGWVIAYDPLTGQELWRCQGTTDSVWPAPIVADDLIISTSGRQGPILAIRPGGDGDVTATHLQWRIRRRSPYIPTGLFYRDRLYLLTDGGVLMCVDPRDGDTLWSERLGGMFSVSLIAGDGKIYAASRRGEVHVIAAGDTFERLAANAVGEPILATPAICKSRLLFRTESHLVCVSGTDDALSIQDERMKRPAASPDAEKSPDKTPDVASPSDHGPFPKPAVEPSPSKL